MLRLWRCLYNSWPLLRETEGLHKPLALTSLFQWDSCGCHLVVILVPGSAKDHLTSEEEEGCDESEAWGGKLY